MCAVEGPTPDTPASNDCQGIPGKYRVLEVSWHLRCGDTHFGRRSDAKTADGQLLGDYWRACELDEMDMACRDRFRLEVKKDSITLYVNGMKYFEDAGWPAAQKLARQLPLRACVRLPIELAAPDR